MPDAPNIGELLEHELVTRGLTYRQARALAIIWLSFRKTSGRAQ